MAALDLDGFCRWLDVPAGFLVELNEGPPGETTDVEAIARAVSALAALAVVGATTSGDTLEFLAGAAAGFAGFYLENETIRAIWEEAGLPFDAMDSALDDFIP